LQVSGSKNSICFFTTVSALSLAVPFSFAGFIFYFVRTNSKRLRDDVGLGLLRNPVK